MAAHAVTTIFYLFARNKALLPRGAPWPRSSRYSGLRLTTNNSIGRIDHDFSPKWRWMSSYRYQRLINVTTNQVDIGGALPGDTLGQPAAKALRQQVDGYFVISLTTNITPTTINDFRYAYLRQFWQWGTSQAPPQLPGLGGALGHRSSVVRIG